MTAPSSPFLTTATIQLITCPECSRQTDVTLVLNRPFSDTGTQRNMEVDCKHPDCHHIFHIVQSPTETTITTSKKRRAGLLRLLKLNVDEINKPIHIVIEDSLEYTSDTTVEAAFAEFIAGEYHAYWFNENTCPKNFLRFPIIEGDETDPHGIFQVVDTALRPKGYSFLSYNTINGQSQLQPWKDLFPNLPVTYDHPSQLSPDHQETQIPSH